VATLRLKNRATGEIVDVEDDDELEQRVKESGLVVATQDELDLWDENQQYGGAGNTLRAAGETALDTATFGAAGAVADAYGEGEAFEGRRTVLARQHPVVDFAAQAGGSVATGLAGGAVLGGAARALGAGTRLAGAAGVLGEGAASGLADEVQMADRQHRPVSVGNAIMLGVGGELVGRAIPKAFSRVLRGKTATKVTDDLLDPTGAATRQSAPDSPALTDYDSAMEDGGLAGALGRTAEKYEAKSADEVLTKSVLDERVAKARELPEGTERTAELAEVGDVIVTQEAKKIADNVGPAEDLARKYNDRGDSAMSRKVLRTQLESVGDIPEQIDAMRSLDAHLDDMARQFEESRVDGPTRTARAWKDLEKARNNFAKEIQTEDRVVMMQATRKYKQALQATHTSLADMRMAKKFDRENLDDFQRLVDAEEGPIRELMESEDIWGAAGKTEAAINLNFHENLMPRISYRDKGVRSITGKSYDAQPGGGRRVQELDRGKIESVLNASEGSRDLQRKAAKQEAAYYEQTAKIHGPEGTGLMSKAEMQSMRDAAQTIRESFALADEVSNAKVLKKHSPSGGGGGADGTLGRIAGTVAGVATGIPGAGVVARAASMFSVNDAAKAKIARSAQRLVRRTADFSERLSTSGGAPAAATALSRFTGAYHSPQQSYDAKREILEDAMRDPATTAVAITDSLMGLADADPDLFEGIAGRQMEMLAYVASNLPAGAMQTLEHPSGVPLSHTELRQVADLWTAVFEPQTTIAGLGDRSTTGTSWDHVMAVHPDLAADVVTAVVEEAQEDPAGVPSSAKTYMQNTMGLGYLFGDVYTEALPMSMNAAAPQQTGPAMPMQSTPLSESDGAPGTAAAGIAAIKGSVTNAQ
jgi:hypothetical protein